MYVKYKYKDKTLFTFQTTKYYSLCAVCGNLTTRKLLISKGVLAKDLHNSVLGTTPVRHYYARFFCSEHCIKTTVFTATIKGLFRARAKLEPWLNAPPQEFIHFTGETRFSVNRKETFKNQLIRVIKNQDGGLNYVEFYKPYASIQFMATTEELNVITSGISNLINTVEEKNA